MMPVVCIKMHELDCRLLVILAIYHVAQNRCDLKMLSLNGAGHGFEHITKI